MAADDHSTGRRRHGPDGVGPLPGSHDQSQSGDPGRNAHHRRRTGRGAGNRGLGRLPCCLRGGVADDRLVHVETGVDDVQEDGFARNDIDGGRTERILARDEIDLSRIRGRPGRRARGGPVRLRVAAGGRYDERCEQQRDGDTSAAVGVRYGQGWASRPSLAVPPAGPGLTRSAAPTQSARHPRERLSPGAGPPDSWPWPHSGTAARGRLSDMASWRRIRPT